MSADPAGLLLAAVYKTLVSIPVALSAVVLNEHLPNLLRGSLEQQIKDEMDHDGPAARASALRLATVASDFISSLGAMLTLYVAILTELWKAIPHLQQIAVLVIFVCAVAVPWSLYISKLKWMGKTEEEYARTIGARLKWIVRGLSTVLVVVPIVLALIEAADEQKETVALQRKLNGVSVRLETHSFGSGTRWYCGPMPPGAPSDWHKHLETYARTVCGTSRYKIDGEVETQGGQCGYGAVAVACINIPE